jgi:TonB family protein
VPPSAQSVLVEILIDETGRVQNVRWLQSVSGYHERMLTSAIKAWRYQPATLAGKPVRYSKRLNLPRP